MKSLFILLFCCAAAGSFAQADSGMYDSHFQFRYLSKGQLSTFSLSYFMVDTVGLSPQVLRSFEENQKSPATEVSWGMSKQHFNNGESDKHYFVIIEFDSSYYSKEHLYNEAGDWLYTVKGVKEEFSPKKKKRLQDLLNKYSYEGEFREYAIKQLNAPSKKELTVLEIYSNVRPEYLPDAGLQKPGEDCTVRLLLNKKMAVVGIYHLFGNSTELREMNWMSPMFL